MQSAHIHWESSRAVWNFWRTISLVCAACGGEGGPDYPSMHGSLWSVLLSSFPNHLTQSVPVSGCSGCFLSTLQRENRPLDTTEDTQRPAGRHTERSQEIDPAVKACKDFWSIFTTFNYILFYHVYFYFKWSQQCHATLFAIRSWCLISTLVWMPSRYHI